MLDACACAYLPTCWSDPVCSMVWGYMLAYKFSGKIKIFWQRSAAEYIATASLRLDNTTRRCTVPYACTYTFTYTRVIWKKFGTGDKLSCNWANNWARKLGRTFHGRGIYPSQLVFMPYNPKNCLLSISWGHRQAQVNYTPIKSCKQLG